MIWGTKPEELKARLNEARARGDSRVFLTDQEFRLLLTMTKVIPPMDLLYVQPGQVGEVFNMAIFLTD